MPGSRRVPACLVVLLLAPFLLSGCIQLLLSGHASDTAGIPTDQTRSLSGVATINQCGTASNPGPGPGMITCQFSDSQGNSYASALATAGAGLFGILLDPLIVQVPANANNFAATYSGAASGNIVVTELIGGFDADSNTHINPEPGHRFVVLDFPSNAPPTSGQRYTFDLTFRQPRGPPPLATKATSLAVKALFAGRVTVDDTTFYPPLLPCVASFSTVPSITIPVAASPQPLSVPTNNVQGCNGKLYTFNASPLATVEVVEFYNASLDHYFVTWLANEAAVLDSGTQRGWTRTGRTFKAYSAAAAGTTPVCRYYLPPAFGDSHFYGRGTTECDATGQQHPQFVLESSTFLHMRLPTAGNCPAGTMPVYRVFSNRTDANHRYMTDRALRDQMVASGWLAEGDGPDLVVMCAPVS